MAGFARGAWGSILGLAQRMQYLGPLGTPLFHAQMTLVTRSAWMLETSWKLCSYDRTAFAAGRVYQATHPKIMAQMSQLDIRAMRMWFYQMRKVADLTSHLSSISVPVLAIAGKQDSLVPSSQTTLIASGVSNGTSILLDKMNHALHVEQPDRVYACMAEWLDVQVAHESP